MKRLLALGVALLTAIVVTPAPASATTTDVPAYGLIMISDTGSGPRALWTYDGLLSCTFTVTGPGGVPADAIVRCDASQSPVSLGCPRMVVSRATATEVGARATCATTLDMGVGTSGEASANLGHVYDDITCEAYVDIGVLVPPYSVTCDEPGLPLLGG